MKKGRTNYDYRNIKIFEAFAGIGSQYKALKNISESKKWNIKHVGMVEWYLDAIIGYIAIHDHKFIPFIDKLNFKPQISLDSKSPIKKSSLSKINNSIKASYINHSKKHFNNLFDIRNVNKNNFPKNIDIFTYSFPCQDLSVQGLQKGINKGDETRSGLLWEIERILKEIVGYFKEEELPKYLLMENVKNLIGKNNINNYKLWFDELDKLGYISKTYVLNSKNFNSPQSRERVFCLSIRKKYKNYSNFNFDDLEKISNETSNLKTIIDNNYDGDYLDFSKYKFTEYKKTKNNVIKKSIIDYTKFNSENYVYNIDGVGPTLTASGAHSRLKIDVNGKIRYMTSYEAIRYMGFQNEDYEKIKKTNLINDSKIIYLSGNSISIQVLENIFNSLTFKD